ncbi:MAG: hypothetical protein KGS48_10330 [Bacteroidetes bacterium]|nr:hypothetical protein [Bacteroidota bacterium]
MDRSGIEVFIASQMPVLKDLEIDDEGTFQEPLGVTSTALGVPKQKNAYLYAANGSP